MSSRAGLSIWVTMVSLTLAAACGTERTHLPLAPALDVSSVDDNGGPHYSEWSVPTTLGTLVNSPDSDFDPFISKDGLSVYFAAGRNRGGSGLRDLWVVHRASIGDPWGEPRNLGGVINTGSHESKPTLSVDGHRLYFTSDRPGGLGGFDLYVSRRRDKRNDFGWEPAINLGGVINSSASEETSVTFFEDDASGATIMYFASNRPGGPGDFDIYASTVHSEGDFETPVVVAELSGIDRDRDPAVRRDGREMFLGSNRPGTFGAMDLWVSSRATTTDPWSTPVNLGSHVNSPTRAPNEEQSNDQRASLSSDGTSLYFSSALRPGNVGFMFDLWVTTREKLTGR